MNTNGHPRWLLPVLAACMVASGACGLVYEVVWARLIGVFLGASAHAHAIVLAGFLGGLAIGNSLFGRLVDRAPGKSLLLYAALEVVIGVYGLLSPEIRLGVGHLYIALVGDAPPGSLTVGAKMLSAGMFVLLPTIAMGGTLPALIRYVATSMDQLGNTVARFYLVNTVGAALGAFSAGMFLVPRFGTLAAVRGAGVVNLLVAIVALIAFVVTRSPELAPEQDEELEHENGDSPAASPGDEPGDVQGDVQGATTTGRNAVLAAAFVMGWATLTMEVSWTRIFAMVFGSSAQAFTLMLSTFIGGIAVGSLFVPTLLRRFHGREAELFSRALLLAALLLVIQIPFYEHLPYWQFRIAQALERRPHVYPVYLACQAALAFAWMFPLTVVTGAALPIATHVYARRFDRIGSSVGTLFTANTLGNVIGPMLATFVLMPLIGLRHTVTVGVIGLALASVLASRAGASRAWTRRAIAIAVTLGLVASLLPDWSGSTMHSGGFRRWTLEAGASFAEFQESRARSVALWQQDGAADSVIVLESREGLRFMKVNGKTDASDAEDLPTQRMVAHLPLLLFRAWHGEPAEDVFVVGLGSGVTVGSAAMHEGAQVTSAELSRGVIEGSRFFDHVNHNVSALPNVTLHEADAREWLERSPQRWDVIVNQPSNPWIAGNAALFSREFFVAARERLAERGIFAQWMHVYSMDDTTVEIVMNTFASVFPHVTVWWPQGVDLLLIGTLEPTEFDLQALDEALQQPWLQEQMQAYDNAGLQLTSLERVLALQVASDEGFRAAFPGTLPHTTDLRPLLEFRAPVAQFVGARSEHFVDIDERLQPGDSTRLEWGRLSPQARDPFDLLPFFAARETPFSERLTGSLQHQVAPHPDADQFAEFATRATGLPVMLEAWTTALLQSKHPELDTCRAYLDAAQSALPTRATAFFRPPLDDVAAVVERCTDGHPPVVAGFLHAMLAELRASCGYHAQALADARGLLAEAQAPAVHEAMTALVERLAE